jgi:anthranilate phosphoribosyltransferase
MRHVGPVRAEIGVRTLFNFLGPLANPAGATHQVVGVSDPRMQTTMARALMQLGSRHGLVVHGHGGLDEIAVSGPTRACRVHGGSLSTIELTPEDFGVATQPEADLGGGDATHNAALIRALFGGERGARRDAVVINAGAALHIAGAADSWRTGAEKAQAAIDSGAASKTLSAWATLSKSSPP